MPGINKASLEFLCSFQKILNANSQAMIIIMLCYMSLFSPFGTAPQLICEIMMLVCVLWPNVIHWRVSLWYETNLSGESLQENKYIRRFLASILISTNG